VRTEPAFEKFSCRSGIRSASPGSAPDDEYDHYIDTIYLMLLDERTDHQRVTDHLLGLATNAMALSDRPKLREKCIVAAAALLPLRPEFCNTR
jgi:hypothetical protein